MTFPVTRCEEALGLQIPSDSALKGAAPALGNRRRVTGAAVRGRWQGRGLSLPRRLPSAATDPLLLWPPRCDPVLPALRERYRQAPPGSRPAKRGGGGAGSCPPAAIALSMVWVLEMQKPCSRKL